MAGHAVAYSQIERKKRRTTRQTDGSGRVQGRTQVIKKTIDQRERETRDGDVPASLTYERKETNKKKGTDCLRKGTNKPTKAFLPVSPPPPACFDLSLVVKVAETKSRKGENRRKYVHQQQRDTLDKKEERTDERGREEKRRKGRPPLRSTTDALSFKKMCTKGDRQTQTSAQGQKARKHTQEEGRSFSPAALRALFSFAF
mmetsp:Transcript_24160/g.47492  ORF Transcript_24160/g.47492 Transcript_24160/m.47492 type:complete len:201 (-) Transcript_24160:215-817(-)